MSRLITVKSGRAGRCTHGMVIFVALCTVLSASPSAFIFARVQKASSRPQTSIERRAVATTDVAAAEVEQDAVATSKKSYIAMNRFMVRDGQGPAFEQRWAQRKSSLRELEGFEWFALLRRVQSPDPSDEYTYSSFTWWDNKKAFNSWKSGPAFKEAHGGGDILSFLGMIVSGFMTSKGPPKPCFWRGCQVDLPSVAPTSRFKGGPGSKPDFDGSKVMGPEVFVSLRRFGDEEGNEEMLRKESQALIGAKGFRFSQVLNRDQEPDDGARAALISVWDAKEDYEASALGQASAPPRGEALYEGVLVLEQDA